MIHPMENYPESIRKLYPILPVITRENILKFIEDKNEEAFLFYLNHYDLDNEVIIKKATLVAIEQKWTPVYSKLIEKLPKEKMKLFIDTEANYDHLDILFNRKNSYYQQILDTHGASALVELQQLQLRRILINDSDQDKLNLCIPNIIHGNHDPFLQGQITNIFKGRQAPLLPAHILKLVEQKWITPLVTLESISIHKEKELNPYEKEIWEKLENYIQKNSNTWEVMMAKASITQVFFPDYPELIDLIEQLPIPLSLDVAPIHEKSFLYHRMLFNFNECDPQINTFLAKQIKEHKQNTISGNDIIELLFALEKQEKNDEVEELLISEEKIRKLKEVQIKKELSETVRPSIKPAIRF